MDKAMEKQVNVKYVWNIKNLNSESPSFCCSVFLAWFVFGAGWIPKFLISRIISCCAHAQIVSLG